MGRDGQTLRRVLAGIFRPWTYPAAALLVGISVAGTLRGADPAVTPSTPLAPVETPATPPADPQPPLAPLPSDMLPGEPGTFDIGSLLPPELAPLPPILSRNPGGYTPQTIVTQQSAQAPDIKQVKFRISKFTFKYGGSKSPHPGLPSPQELADTPVVLGAGKGQDPLVAPGAGTHDETLTLAKLNGARTFRGDALQAVFTALVARLNKQGIQGVFVLADNAQIDSATLADKRAGTTGLTLLVYVSEVSKVRTIVKPVGKWPLRAPSTSPTDTTYQRITDNSPLQKPEGDRRGSLLEQGTLQNYLDRINRFPGRRVDVAITAAGEAGSVVLDYIVHVERPSYFVYDQTSNTGTEASGTWRSRLGLEVRQIAHLDDILDLAFESSLSSATYSGTGSYLLTPVFPDKLKVKLYGAYGRFNAEDVGFDQENFTGRAATVGVQIIYTPVYLFPNSPFQSFKSLPLDLIAGLEYRYTSINNESFGTGGHGSFLLPTFGISTDRTTEDGSVFANTQVQFNVYDTDRAALQNMGRLQTSTAFTIIRYGVGYTHYLDPWVHRKDFENYQAESDVEKRKGYWHTVKLAHEISVQIHGQHTFADKRLIPQFEDVIGGFTTVRGYPEALASGDSSFVFNGEYRYHVSRGLLKPLDTDEKEDPAKPRPNRPFTLSPPTILGRPDLDFLVRAFFDLGYSENNPIHGANEAGRQSLEADRVLASVGLGAEVQVSRYLDLRLDCGFPLLGIDDNISSRKVDVGEPRVSFIATLTY